MMVTDMFVMAMGNVFAYSLFESACLHLTLGSRIQQTGYLVMIRKEIKLSSDHTQQL